MVGEFVDDGPNWSVPLSVALVLCSRHRPDDVKEALATIAIQSELPADVVVVDSSDDDRTRDVVSEASSQWPSQGLLRYVHTTPSLTHQRRVGIAQTSSDIVMFIDDDVRVDVDYCKAVLDVFQRDTSGSVHGVGGFIAGQATRRVRTFDVVVGLDSRVEGVMLRSGRNIPVVTEPAGDVDVDWLSGATMSYRRSALDAEPPNDIDFPFEGEDADLSFRIRAHGRLVVTPRARATHLEAQANRVAGAAQAKAELSGRLRRVAQHPGRLSTSAALVAAVAQLLKFGVLGLLTMSRRRLALARGTAEALLAHSGSRNTR